MTGQDARLADILRRTPGLMAVLETARGLALPDWMVFSGAVWQPAWNALTGRPLDHGLSDYDLAYYDDGDLSWAAEDAVIRRAEAAFQPPPRARVEVRNQARVHLWFENHFGEAYAPLGRTAEALERFVATAFAVGVRLEPDGRLSIFAPFGLEDRFALRLRPNPLRASTAFDHIAEKVRQRWPEARIEG